MHPSYRVEVFQSLDDLQRKSQKKNRSQVEECASISGLIPSSTYGFWKQFILFAGAHMDETCVRIVIT